MQLRNKITVARTQNVVVLGLEVADGMVNKKQHSNNWKSDSTSFYMTSDFYLSTWTC